MCAGPSIKEAVVKLQAVFNIIQKKTKVMLFSKAKKTLETTLDIVTAQGKVLKVVTCYKYLGIWLDD